MVLPRFVDAHMHLDKTLMGEPWIGLPETRTLAERVAAAEDLLKNRTTRTVLDRATALAESARRFGTLALRSHADVTPGLGLSSVETLLQVRERFAGDLDIQLVAFPQDGAIAPGVAGLLEESLRMGCTVLGGLDPAGYDGDIEAHLRLLFTLAPRLGADIDIHLHDGGTLGLFEIGRICAWTEQTGYGGKVAVSHAFALGDRPLGEVQPVLERMARAGVSAITAASGAAAVPPAPALWAAGVRLGIGSDNVHDSWSPFARGDVLEKAFLVAYRNNLRTDAGLLRTLETITDVNSGLLGLEPVRVEVGAAADLVVVDAENGAEAVAAHPPRLLVLKAGRRVGFG
ncbi:MAG: amidohydrolase family protein [Chloroflexi bacterium]|nr:amidohydrolase family protein [Chloroflexota bacterium]